MVKATKNFPVETAIADLQNLAYSLQAQMPNAQIVFDGQNGSLTISKTYETGDDITPATKDIKFSMRDDSPTLQVYSFELYVRNRNGDFARSGLPDSVAIAKIGLEFADNQLKAKANADVGTKTISWNFPNPASLDPISLAYSEKYNTIGKEKLFVNLKIGWAYAFQPTENPATFTR